MTKNEKKKLIIFGTGLLSEVVTEYFKDFTQYEIYGYMHDTDQKQDSFLNKPVFHISQIEEHKDKSFFLAIGYKKMNTVREEVFVKLKTKKINFTNFIHPSVKIFNSSKIGENVLILENNTIQPYVNISSNTFIWSSNHIGHHTQIEENVFISSNVVIAGNCHIGKNTFIGINSSVADSTNVGEKNFIGPNSLIKHKTKSNDCFIPKSTEVHKIKSNQLKF